MDEIFLAAVEVTFTFVTSTFSPKILEEMYAEVYTYKET